MEGLPASGVVNGAGWTHIIENEGVSADDALARTVVPPTPLEAVLSEEAALVVDAGGDAPPVVAPWLTSTWTGSSLSAVLAPSDHCGEPAVTPSPLKLGGKLGGAHELASLCDGVGVSVGVPVGV